MVTILQVTIIVMLIWFLLGIRHVRNKIDDLKRKVDGIEVRQSELSNTYWRHASGDGGTHASLNDDIACLQRQINDLRSKLNKVNVETKATPNPDDDPFTPNEASRS